MIGLIGIRKNVDIKVREALAFAYLEDVIKCTTSVDDAVKLIQS